MMGLRARIEAILFNFNVRFVAAMAVSLAFLDAGVGARSARAGEADDLQRAIDVGKRGASDLERLDELRAARPEIQLVRDWLSEAWNLRSQEKYDEVRVVLDRCDAQAEMIRQKILASSLAAEASSKEAALQKKKAEVAKLKQALQAATLEKASLEGKAK
jgi:hypothetical protein